MSDDKIMQKPLKVWEAIGRLSGGGAETQVVMLSKGLVERSIEVSVLYVLRREMDPELPDCINDHFIPRESKTAWWQVFKTVGELMDAEKPDLVHVWLPEVISIPVAFAAYRRGIPVLSSIRRSTFKGVTGLNWFRDLMGLVPHFFARRIVSNFPLCNEPVVVRWLARRKEAVVIQNGLDLHRYANGSVTDKPLRLVFVGRFANQKRLPFLLNAIGALPRGAVTLVVYGEGSAESLDEIESIIREHELSDFVKLEGFQPNWRVYAGDFDFLVTPSISEGMPNVVLEAMAEGVPVIASNIPEMREVISHGGNGLLFQADCIRALVDVIESHLDIDLEAMRACARETAEKYSSEIMVSRYIRLYLEVIKEDE
tara:strand:- start:5959 stop:7068 length:1110 start_codon:yes stop_codon:yes gene_type:complete